MEVKKITSKAINGADEAHAYTPGLKIKTLETIKKNRNLPIEGEVLVKIGDTVAYDTVVAKTDIPGDPRMISISENLGVDIRDLKKYLKKNVGDDVKKGDILAQDIAFFGFIKKFVYAPIDGHIEALSDITGQMTIRAPSIPIEVNSYIQGKVIGINPNKGAVVETKGALLQGIFGIGGENHGEIAIATPSNKDILTADYIKPEHAGKIIIGGSLITGGSFKKAREVGVKGIVSGGIEINDLIEILEEDIGVAITGEEELGLTVIITEGFGNLAMSNRAYKLLKNLEGKMACINGTTQIRAGVLRPEIIIPYDKPNEYQEVEETIKTGMTKGSLIRIIREPYFGKIASVSSLPVELQIVESGSSVRVVEVELEDGSLALIPRANVEVIEE